jgi:hypothetical protein
MSAFVAEHAAFNAIARLAEVLDLRIVVSVAIKAAFDEPLRRFRRPATRVHL